MSAKTPSPRAALSPVDSRTSDTEGRGVSTGNPAAPDTAPPAGASTLKPADSGDGSKPVGAGGGAPKNAAAKALAVERRQIAERMEAIKNEKLRRQLEQMEAELAPPKTKSGETDTAEDADGMRIPDAVPPASTQPRHWMALAGFLLMVLGPVIVSGWYLFNRAHDRYVSYAGFSVRTEEIGSAFELLGGVASLSGSSGSDTDILYKFIESPELVARIDADLDLRAIWSKAGRDWSDPSDDPVFAYKPDGVLAGFAGGIFGAEEGGRGSIEDLTAYWSHMVNVYSDSGTGLIDLEVQAFDPRDAQIIATRIYDESTAMINRLSAIARDDTTRYAREELDQAVERLKTAREALTLFRNETQIVDPSASIQGQMGLLSSLQAQLAQTLIDLDILSQTAQEGDPRLSPLQRRVEVIEVRIEAERGKLGMGADGAPTGTRRAFADLVGEYERLAVDQEFAQQSYTAALANYDTALAEAQRQSRYLAAHVNPTLPESSTQPDRLQALGLVALFAFLIWATLILAVYALRDRR